MHLDQQQHSHESCTLSRNTHLTSLCISHISSISIKYSSCKYLRLLHYLHPMCILYLHKGAGIVSIEGFVDLTGLEDLAGLEDIADLRVLRVLRICRSCGYTNLTGLAGIRVLRVLRLFGILLSYRSSTFIMCRYVKLYLYSYYIFT
jgi:hypothetical protein